jgi:hypothetical protein
MVLVKKKGKLNAPYLISVRYERLF